jgi:hypothetical protein
MAFHDDLLEAARSMIRSGSGVSVPQAILRRGISTAYYALFHLLIHETMSRLIAAPDARADLGRAINHEPTRKICQQYSDAVPSGNVWKISSGDEILEELKQVGSTFVKLIQARYTADYDPNPAKDFNPQDAEKHLSDVEKAFANLIAVQSDPATLTFLTRIFLESLGRRRT